MLMVCHTKSTQHKHSCVEGLSSLQQIGRSYYKICNILYSSCGLRYTNDFFFNVYMYRKEKKRRLLRRKLQFIIINFVFYYEMLHEYFRGLTALNLQFSGNSVYMFRNGKNYNRKHIAMLL